MNSVKLYIEKFSELCIYNILLFLPLILSKNLIRPYLSAKILYISSFLPLTLGIIIVYFVIKGKIKLLVKGSILILSFCIIMLISSYFSDNVRLSFLISIRRIFIILCAFFAGFFIYDKRKVDKVIFIITLVSLFISLHSISQFCGHDFLYKFFPWKPVEDISKLRAIPATLGNPDYVGGFLAITIFWIMAWIIIFGKNLFFIIAFFLSLIALFLTQTRSAYLGFIIAFFYLLWQMYKIGNKILFKKMIKISFIAFFILFVIVLGFLLFYKPFQSEFVVRMEKGLNLLESSFQMRMLHWEITVTMFFDNIWTGISPGLYRIKYLDYLFDFLNRQSSKYFQNIIYSSKGKIAGDAHNDFFQIFAEEGIFGGSVFILIWLVLFLLTSPEKENNYREKIISIMIKTSILSALIHSLFSFPFHLYVRSFYIWFITGLGYAIIFLKNSTRKNIQ